MYALFKTEMAKQWRRPRTYIALGFTMLIPIIVTIALKANPPSLDDRDANDAFFYFATKTGLYLPVAALRVMSRFLLVIVVALFAGDAVASEASWGNLRAMLVRPISQRPAVVREADRGRDALAVGDGADQCRRARRRWHRVRLPPDRLGHPRRGRVLLRCPGSTSRPRTGSATSASRRSTCSGVCRA